MSLGQIKRTKEIQGEKADIFNVFMISCIAETNCLGPRKESPNKLSAFFYHAGEDHTSNFFWVVVMSPKKLPGKYVDDQAHAIGEIVSNSGQFDIDS